MYRVYLKSHDMRARECVRVRALSTDKAALYKLSPRLIYGLSQRGDSPPRGQALFVNRVGGSE